MNQESAVASRPVRLPEGALQERLSALRKSQSGYIGTITRLCKMIDSLLNEFGNLEDVRSLQSQLQTTWENFQHNYEQQTSLVDEESYEYQKALARYNSQLCRKQEYDEKVENFVAAAATYFNEQVVNEFEKAKFATSSGSITSRASKVSDVSSKLRDAKLIAAKTALLQQQAQEKKRRAIEIERTRMELEMKQKELELQQRLKLTELETEDDIFEAKNKAELANLEARFAEEELSVLLHESKDREDVTTNQVFPPASSDPLQAFSVVPPVSSSDQANANPSLPCLAHTRTSPAFTTTSYMLPQQVLPVPVVCANQTATLPDTGFLTPSPAQVANETLLTTIASTMEKISMSQDLPAIQIQKFDGSPERFPVFRQRFYQTVESKPLDEPAKMTRLLQFLEGPALKTVQRYKSVPGGLAKALEVLRDRFGRPCQIVRACVDTLTKGPAIAPSDKEGLQCFADSSQVMFDILEAMDCLGEMNTENLERMILCIPKWAQGKFGEYLKKIEREGRAMPTFKDVVSFLKDRADVANHPFFTKTSGEIKINYPPSKSPPFQQAMTPAPPWTPLILLATGGLNPVPCVIFVTHSIAVTRSSPSQHEIEVNSSKGRRSASIVSAQLSIPPGHANQQ